MKPKLLAIICFCTLLTRSGYALLVPKDVEHNLQESTQGTASESSSPAISGVEQIEKPARVLLEKPLTLSEAKALFLAMAHSEHIPFRFPEDGCWHRATLMCAMAHQLKVPCQRIFAVGNGNFERSTLETKSMWLRDGSVTWKDHVAVVIPVLVGQETHLMVFDPSLNEEPVEIEEWLSMFSRTPKNFRFAKDLTSPDSERPKDLQYYFLEERWDSSDEVTRSKLVTNARAELAKERNGGKSFLTEHQFRLRIHRDVQRVFKKSLSRSKIDTISHMAISLEGRNELSGMKEENQINRIAWPVIAQISTDHPDWTPFQILLSALKDENWKVKSMAALALEKIIETEDDANRVFDAILSELQKLTDNESISFLSQVLGSVAPRVMDVAKRRSAIESLLSHLHTGEEVGPGPPLTTSLSRFGTDVVPFLVEVSEADGSKTAKLGQPELEILQMIGPSLVKYVPLLTKWAKGQDDELRQHGIQLLGTAGKNGVTKLVEMLKTEPSDEIFRSLQGAGESGRIALPELWEITESLGRPLKQRLSALEAIVVIGLKEEDLKKITAFFAKKTPVAQEMQTQVMLLRGIEKLLPTSSKAFATLRELLKNGHLNRVKEEAEGILTQFQSPENDTE